MVIPLWLRKEYHIEDGTRAVVTATPEGILLKPVTTELIRRGRGLFKHKKEDRSLTKKWMDDKKLEKELEDRFVR